MWSTVTKAVVAEHAVQKTAAMSKASAVALKGLLTKLQGTKQAAAEFSPLGKILVHPK